MIFNNTGVQLGTLMIGGDTTSVSVGVANSDYYNITLTANTNCGTSTETSAGVSKLSITIAYYMHVQKHFYIVANTTCDISPTISSK